MNRTNIIACLRAYRPLFITASVAPVLVGSTAGYAAGEHFNTGLFTLALTAIVFLHIGSNAANEYFDYLSGNDSANDNSSEFSGGSKGIQKGLITAKHVLYQSLAALAIGAAFGLIIIFITKSLFILTIGIIGLLGGYFYTALPLKISYRGFGELLIAFLFGIVPVFGSYYLQTERLGVIVILPALSVALLIFLIILINEFPDRQADASVNKKTFVVKYGVKKSIITYKSVLTLSYITAVFMLFFDITFRAGLLYLFTLPLGIWAFTSANQSHLEKTSSLLPNKLTILLHITGSVLLAVGFLIYAQRT